MRPIALDLATLNPEQLRIYADALNDSANELAALRHAAAEAAAQLEQERARADQIYHDAYCGCHQKMGANETHRIVRE